MYKASMRSSHRVSIGLRHSPETAAIKNVRDERRHALKADDSIGEAIYDQYSEIADVVEALDGHELVLKFGFAADMLVTPRGNPMRAEYLAVVTAACRAARELADMAGKGEVIKVLGWKGEIPSKLSGFGVDVLFRNAGILQGVVETIKETRRREVEAKAKAKPAIILPAARQSTKPLAPAAKLVKPEGSDAFGRISTAQGLAFRCVCGCGGLVLESAALVPPIGVMRERQDGNRVGSKDLWRHAFGERCISRFGRGFSLKETMRTMMDEELKREAASRNLHPRFGDITGNGGAFGGSGNGAPAAQLAKKAARAEKDRQIRSAMQSAGKKK